MGGTGPEAPGVYFEHAHGRLRPDEASLRAAVRRVAAGESVEVASLGIVLAGHTLVRDLNVRYLGHDYDTDVLSFALEEFDAEGLRVVDGEIYIDLDTAAERAPEFGVTFEHEVARYLVHGLLHLIGYDDDAPEDRRAMRRLEDRYLAADRAPHS